MSKDTEDKKTEEKKSNLQNLRQLWAKNDIERSAEMSRKKLDRIIDEERQQEVYDYFDHAETESIDEALKALGEDEYSEEPAEPN